MALAFVPVGDERVIQEFRGDDNIKRRLMDLGLVKGEKVQILSESPSGFIVLVKGVRLALNKSLALKIMVA